MPRCCVPGCENDQRDKACADLHWHTFPLSDKKLLSAWLARIRRKDFMPNKHSRICSEHFDANCYERDLQSEFVASGELSGYKIRRRRYLKPGSTPSLKLGGKPVAKPSRAASAYFRKREHEEVRGIYFHHDRSFVFPSLFVIV